MITPTPNSKSARAWLIVRHVNRGLSAALLILVVALSAATVFIPKATGAIPLTVLTSSMEPSLPPGTLIVVKPVRTNALRVGDVATCGSATLL